MIDINNVATEQQEAVNDVEYFGKKEMRWYQVAARNEVAQILEATINNKHAPRICIVAPTGSGKTVTNGSILANERIRKVLTKGENRPLRVLFISHKHRLLSQAERAYGEIQGVKTITLETLHASTMIKK